MQQKYLPQVVKLSTFLLLLVTLSLLWHPNVGQKSADSQSIKSTGFISKARTQGQGKSGSTDTIGTSSWQKNIQQKATDALAGSNSDLLIVPFQSFIDKHEFDSTTRSLLTLTNARAFNDSTIKIADPLLVSEALGSNRSHYELDEIAKLAEQVNSNQVLLSFVGHNENNKLSFHQALFERRDIVGSKKSGWSDFKEIAKVSRDDILFGPTNLPYYAYKKINLLLLQEIFGFEFKQTQSIASNSSVELDSSVQSYIDTKQDNKILSAKKLQFLALLHPEESAEEQGRSLYVRSLVELDSVEPSSNVNYLRAVALIALDRRPAALKLLGTESDSPHKKTLLEYANGNLVSSKVLAAIPDLVEKTSAQVRNQRLINTYRIESDKDSYSELNVPGSWRALAVNAFNDGKDWRDTDNSYLKLLLDQIAPDKRLSFGSTMTRLALTRSNTSGAAIEKAILDHIEKVDFDSPTNSLNVRRTDVLNLIRVQLAENIYDRIYKELNLRELPEQAEDYIELYEPLFAGQPDFSLIASKTYKKRASGDSITTQQAIEYRDKAKEFGKASFLNTSNSRSRTRSAFVNLTDIDKLSHNDRQRLLRITQWPRNSCQFVFEELEKCLDNTITGFHTFMTMIQNTRSAEDKVRILTDNHNRFKGNPSRLDFLFTTYKQLENENGLQLIKEELAKTGNTDWALLKRLADTSRLKSNFNEAADIILSYPEFDEANKKDTVQASNRGFEISSRMYWAGAHQAASRLYQNAASGKTGAAAEIAARARLATINGDYQRAAEHQYQRVQRYHSSFAMRDLMGLVSVLSGGGEALSLSYSLTPFLTKPEVWHGSLIAHRANASSNEQQIEWVESHKPNSRIQSTADEARRYHQLALYSSSYLLMMSFMDRTTNNISIERISGHLQDQNINLHVPDSIPDTWLSQGLIPTAQKQRSWKLKSLNTRLTAAQAMKLLYAGKFDKADKILNEGILCHDHYDTEEFLWLCAWTASHTGRSELLTTALEAKIEKTKLELALYSDPAGRLFDHYISLAMLYAFDGRHDEALELLYLANADHRYTEGRTFLVRYHLLEVARILFESTDDFRYRSFVLELARNYTVTDPISAYNHSFIAMMSSNREERVSALTTLTFMDPASRAIERADLQELEEARMNAKNRDTALIQNVGEGI